MKKENKLGTAIAGVVLLAIAGIASGCGNAAPAGGTSPVASPSASSSAVASPTSVISSAPTVKATTKLPRTAAPPPAPTTAPSTSSGCYPLTNGGNCYEPGEYCRKGDHGAAGVAGDGEHIICEDNDGWRWEPA